MSLVACQHTGSHLQACHCRMLTHSVGIYEAAGGRPAQVAAPQHCTAAEGTLFRHSGYERYQACLPLQWHLGDHVGLYYQSGRLPGTHTSCCMTAGWQHCRLKEADLQRTAAQLHSCSVGRVVPAGVAQEPAQGLCTHSRAPQCCPLSHLDRHRAGCLPSPGQMPKSEPCFHQVAPLMALEAWCQHVPAQIRDSAVKGRPYCCTAARSLTPRDLAMVQDSIL